MTVNWGDDTREQQSKVAGEKPFTAHHAYEQDARSYYVVTRERATAGHCKVSPASWKAEFTIGIRS